MTRSMVWREVAPVDEAASCGPARPSDRLLQSVPVHLRMVYSVLLHNADQDGVGYWETAEIRRLTGSALDSGDIMHALLELNDLGICSFFYEDEQRRYRLSGVG